ncbi:MAG: hypothetical protein H0V29_13895 [Thermoleophilaceae bacterium]|nr:hypothetical protein [Thermoleophilaceae bacterium]
MAPTTNAEAPSAGASACDSIKLGGTPHVFYKQGVSCRFAKSWVYRLYGSGGGKRPSGFKCSSGSGFRSGGYCARGSKVFGWHPYD